VRARSSGRLDLLVARLIGDAELWVDGAAWDDAVKRIADALEDLHTAARPPRTPGTTHVSATAMLVAVDASSPC
jgi:hypothetical protein